MPEPDTTPIAGWKSRRLPGGTWRAGLEGERVAGSPTTTSLRGATVGVTDSKGDSSNTTILEVVGRTETSIIASVLDGAIAMDLRNDDPCDRGCRCSVRRTTSGGSR